MACASICPGIPTHFLEWGFSYTLFEQSLFEGGSYLENNIHLTQLSETGKPAHKRLKLPVAKTIYSAFLAVMGGMMFAHPTYAAETTDIWDKANEIMKDVYDQILLISTIAAIVTASIALLMMNFSRNGRTVDESRAWLKRIVITWAVLNGLGFIMAYITPFFADGKWISG